MELPIQQIIFEVTELTDLGHRDRLREVVLLNIFCVISWITNVIRWSGVQSRLVYSLIQLCANCG